LQVFKFHRFGNLVYESVKISDVIETKFDL